MKKRSRRGKVKALLNPGTHPTRTEALLAQLLLYQMGDTGQQKKALALRHAGFSNAAIAELMGTTADVVAQVLYTARRGRAKTAKVKRPKRSKR